MDLLADVLLRQLLHVDVAVSGPSRQLWGLMVCERFLLPGGVIPKESYTRVVGDAGRGLGYVRDYPRNYRTGGGIQ